MLLRIIRAVVRVLIGEILYDARSGVAMNAAGTILLAPRRNDDGRYDVAFAAKVKLWHGVAYHYFEVMTTVDTFDEARAAVRQRVDFFNAGR